MTPTKTTLHPRNPFAAPYPLAELAPELELPDGTALSTLLMQVPLNGLQPLPLAANTTLCDLAQADS